ncbi:MAG: protein kinase domain-containing protein [Polyangiaceae bacterium]
MQPLPAPPAEPRVIGRYALYDEIASGGMATVHLGRLLGSAGFSRTVAIKRLHPQFAKDQDFVTMFVDEARLAARIHNPNVVATLDVVSTDGELFLVMEYVVGESLGRLIPLARARGENIPPATVGTVMAGVLHGLHAAHEARDERGVPLGIVHRDVSPQNVLVGVDGTARVLDFGVAKAAGRLQTTRDGQLKGKIAYMAPEQIRGVVDRTTDVYAASVVMWESLTGKRLFHGESEAETMARVLDGRVPPPSAFVEDVPSALEQIVLRGLQVDPSKRFQTAGEMALAIEEAVPMVAASRIGRWVQQTAAQRLAARTERMAAMESNSAIRGPGPGPTPPPGAEALLTPSGSGMAAGPLQSGIVPAPQLTDVPAAVAAVQRPSRGAVLPVAAGALVLAVVAGVIVALLAVRHRQARLHTVERPLPVAAPVEPAAPIAPRWASGPEEQATVAAPAASPEPSVATIAVSSLPTVVAPLPRTAVGARPAPVHPHATSTAAAPAAAHPAADCNPPYYFDAQGDRIFKKECL